LRQENSERMVLSPRRGLAYSEVLVAPFSNIGSFRKCCIKPYQSSEILDHLEQRYKELGIRDNPNSVLNFNTKPGENIDKFLKRHAKSLIEAAGPTAVLKPNHENPGLEILHWRWISLALPPELILAAANTGNAKSVRLLDHSLKILDPVAHLHFHATAGISFSQIWNNLDRGLSFFSESNRETPDGFKDFKEWESWLLRALVTKHILRFWIQDGFKSVKNLFRQNPTIKLALLDMVNGEISLSTSFVESTLRNFVRLQSIEYLQNGNQSGHNTGKDYSRMEINFDQDCLRHIKSDLPLNQKKLFRKLWIQTTRIKVMLYRHLVYDPVDQCLGKFTNRFKRLDTYTYLQNRIENEVESAINLDRDIQVEKLELRKSPGGLSKLLEMNDLSVQLSSENNKPDLTWTLHFIRNSGLSLKDQIRKHYITAEKLSRHIRGRPELLKSIRGLDVAGHESSGPLWSVAGPLQQVRKESRKTCLRNPGILPLQITVHAGEDFNHLLTGLRSIHEPFWWKIMQRGDRIGHAMALGWNPHEWCANNPIVYQPRIERMMDIAWMLDFIADKQIKNISPTLIEKSKNELQKHLQKWTGGGSWRYQDFISIIKNMGKAKVWEKIGGALWVYHQFEGKWKLLKKILDDYDGPNNDMVEVNTEQECDLLLSLRNEIVKILARWRTPLEINPSSNLLIGNLSYPLAQPLFGHDPYDRNEPLGLVLTLSADDPICFSTCLADEYAYAWAGLVIQGEESPTFAHEWLNRVAQASRRAAFEN